MAHGKRYKTASETVDRDKTYPLEEAVKIVKANARAKFDETIEVAMNLGIDPRHADQAVRGMIELPNGTGKSVRVAVFARGPKAEEAKAAGADLVGAEDLAEKINAGEINFERCVATPDMMGVVGRLGKVLGPRGLMPNPKLGTVTQDVTAAVKAAKAGSIEFRAEKAGIIHAGVGKASFSEEAITANVKALVSAINRAKPSGAKGTFIKKVSLSSTMGPGVKLHLSETAGASSSSEGERNGATRRRRRGLGNRRSTSQVRARARTSGAGEPDREVSVRAYPLTEAAWSVTQPVRSGSPGLGQSWRKP